MSVSLSARGKNLLLPVFFAIASLTSTACGPTMPQLRTKAAKDFDCPKEAVKLATVDSDTMYASCYEREATYTSNCEGEEGCIWVQDKKLDKGATKENY